MLWFKKKTNTCNDELLEAVEKLAFCRTTDVITDRELPFPGKPFHSKDTDQTVDKLVGIFMRCEPERAMKLRRRINALPFGLTGLNYLAEQERK